MVLSAAMAATLALESVSISTSHVELRFFALFLSFNAKMNAAASVLWKGRQYQGTAAAEIVRQSNFYS